MKIENLKVKENIGADEIVGAIEYISNACFANGGYNPYFLQYGQRMAIFNFFLEGVELEEGDTIFNAINHPDIKRLISKFFGDVRVSKEAVIMNDVMTNAKEVIEFKKQRLIHGADAIEYIATAINRIDKYVGDLDTALGNLVNFDWSSINAEDIEVSRDILKKLKESGVELSMDTIADIIKKAAHFDVDKASQEIIDAKNAQIIELEKKTKKLEEQLGEIIAESVKKEDDGK